MTYKAAAYAIALHLWTRHRVGWLLLPLAVLAMAVIAPVIRSYTDVRLVIIACALPVELVFGYLMNALLFGDEAGNFASGYPRRLFTLPVPTPALVFWPVFYGIAGVVLLWLVMAILVFRPAGVRTPLVVPAFALAAGMVWVQAISWWPSARAWQKVLATCVALPALLGLGLWLGLLVRITRLEMIGLMMLYVLVAFVLSLIGVSSARRGESYSVGFPSIGLRSLSLGPARVPFRSRARAQLWFEFWSTGWVLPVFTSGTLVFIFVVTSLPHQSDGSLLGLAAVILAMPVLFGGSMGTNLARMEPIWLKPGRGLAFAATRPITSGGLTAAKFAAAAISSLVSITLSTLAAGCFIFFHGEQGALRNLWWAALEHYGTAHTLLVAAALFLVLTLATFRTTTDALAAGLTGRKLIEGIAAVSFGFLIIAGVAVAIYLQIYSRYTTYVLRSIPVLVAAVTLLKVLLSMWAFRAAMRRSLISRGQTVLLVSSWLVLSLGLTGLSLSFMPPDLIAFPRFTTFLGMAGFLPLARFALAPLALEWNRHR